MAITRVWNGAMALALCLVLALAGCGDNGDDAASADKPPAQGDTVHSEQQVFPHWTEICQKEPENACVLVRDVIEEQSKARAWRGLISVDRATGKGIFTIVVPLGVPTQAEVKVKIDEAAGRSLRISHCTNNGCVINFEIDKKFYDALRTGAQIHTDIPLPNGSTMKVSVGLDGFKKWSEGKAASSAP